MSGFPVPAKAIEDAAREAFWTDDVGGHIKGRWTWDTITEEGRANYRTMVEAALKAASPGLADDPGLIKRAAHALIRRHGWEPEDCRKHDETAEFPLYPIYESDAKAVLAALFGVASPSTKETRDA